MLTVEGGGDCSLRLGFSGFIVVVRWRCGGLTKVQPVRFSAGRDARAVEGARWYRWQGLAGVVREVCDGFFVLFGRARVWVSADDGRLSSVKQGCGYRVKFDWRFGRRWRVGWGCLVSSSVERWC